MLRTIQNFLIGVQVWPLAITAFVAVSGAFIALFGALLGSNEIMEFGKSSAGFGAAGFFVWLVMLIVVGTS
jgi:hypothetical protein